MRKAGDRVKIRSREWIDEQNKDEFGVFMAGHVAMVEPQFQYAGKEATIIRTNGEIIILDIDDGKWLWSNEMFEEEING